MDTLKKDKSIQCQKHPDYFISALDITLKTNSVLKCQECFFEDEGQTKDYLSLKSIQTCSDDHIFTNWPPVDDINLLKEIKKSIEIEDLNLEEIEQHFSVFIQEILEKLQLKKKIIIQQILQRKKDKEEMLNLYNKLSDKQKLKQLASLNNNRQIQKQIKNLTEFVQNALSQKNISTDTLKQQFSKIQFLKNFQSDQLSKMKESIIKQVDEFQPFIQNQQQQQYQGINLFEKGSRCGYDYSKNIQIQDFRQENKIQIIQQEGSYCGGIFFNYNINKDNIYKIRFNFNKIFFKLFIGLVDSNLITQDLSDLARKYDGQKMQIKYFDQTYEQKTVEMLIDIKNSKIQFSDYPQYQYTDRLNGIKSLDTNLQFFLAIHFECSFTRIPKIKLGHQHIDLIYFQEIKN